MYGGCKTMKTKKLSYCSDEVILLFEVFANATFLERVEHCIMYMIKPNYMLERYKYYFGYEK